MGTSTGAGEIPPAKLAPLGDVGAGENPVGVLTGSAGDAPAVVHGCTLAARTSTVEGIVGLVGDDAAKTLAWRCGC